MPYIPTTVVQQSGGGGFSQSYIGYNTVGASFENMDAGRAYCKTVTLASDGLLTGISAHVKGNGTNVGAFGGAVYTDSGSAPTLVIAYQTLAAITIFLNTTARWVNIPMGVWLTAGTYWIGVWSSNVTAASVQLAFDAGADKYVDTDNPWVADASVGTPGTTVNSYSIRGNLLS